MNNVSQGLLQAGHKVKILTIFTQKHDFTPELLPEDYVEKTGIEGVYIDTRINAVDAFSAFLTSDSYNISRFFSTDFDIRLTKWLKREAFDIIHLESLFMAPYIGTIKRYSSAPIVLRTHNLEYVIWEKIALGTSNPLKRMYLKYLASKLRNYEVGALNQVSGIAAISEEDRHRFLNVGVKKKIKTIPFGVEMNRYRPGSIDDAEFALFHLGAMDWGPNLEGISWFLNSIWPRIHVAFPQLKLHLAGRNMPKEIMGKKYPQVIIDGDIQDAMSYMNSKKIMVVPLLSAGGVRIKIIEGLALGRVVISTTLGAEGLDCEDGQQILLADRAEDWIRHIQSLMDHPEKIQEISASGRKHAETHFDQQQVTSELVSFYKELRKE
ncbi:MAG: glycosyltransferase [Flavobacteriales bacterium]